jgi:HK97 gp10 family phage protein
VAISAKLTITGLNEYLTKIQAAGSNIDDAVKAAIHESAKPIHGDVKAWAQKHKFTGGTLSGVEKGEIKQDGNYISEKVGISGDGTSWHATFVEYGSPHNTADPGIRNAIDNNKSKVKRIQRDVLKKAGVPVD